MDVSEYIPARIRALRERRQELSIEIVRVEAAIAELMNMVTADEPEKPAKKK